MTTVADTDDALMARLAQRDQDALRELYRRYAALVFGIATRFVGPTTAEEVVQDVFITLWDKHESFDAARGAFRPWIVQIARRRALNTLRSAKTEKARIADADADELASDAELPDETEWLAHRRDVVRAAVESLPEAQRRALSLAFFDDLTHEQVARALGTPLGTTKTRIRLALKRLAPVLVAALVTVAIVLYARRREQVVAQSEEALRMVTASDVVPLRLGPTPSAPPEAHGNYRTRPGAGVAVLTTSDLPPIASGNGATYVAWAHRDSGWQQLGPAVIEADGRSLLVVSIAPGSPPPDTLMITRETAPRAEPQGTVVLRWTR